MCPSNAAFYALVTQAVSEDPILHCLIDSCLLFSQLIQLGDIM